MKATTEQTIERMNKVVFNGDGRAEPVRLDSLWSNQAGSGHSHAAVLIDMSAVEYMQHDLLQYLIAIMKARQEEDLDTFLQLPTSDHVRYFMNAWRFPDTIERILDRDYEDVLTPLSRKAYRHDETSEENPYVKYFAGPGGRELSLSTNFLGLTKIEKLRTPYLTAANEESRWLRPDVVAVLNKLLNNKALHLIGRVIKEAVWNSARHPDAEEIYISSQFLRPKTPSMPKSLADEDSVSASLTFWDDGTSISETLAESLYFNQSITGPAFGEEKDETFRVTYTDPFGGSTTLTTTSTDVPEGVNREMLTLAAFFLGVTSDPYGTTGEPGSEPGVGLHNLKLSAINDLGGIVQYASGYVRLTIRRATDGLSDYRAHINAVGEDGPRVHGNLLVVRTPATVSSIDAEV